MTTVNDGLNRDLNSLVKERRKAGGEGFPPAAAKTAIPPKKGTATNTVTMSPTSSRILTEVTRLETSFVVPAGGTVYVPTSIGMQDADGNDYVYFYSQPTIE